MLVSGEWGGERRTADGFRAKHDGYGCAVAIGCAIIFWAALIATLVWALS
jgi:hypothetical protein